MSKPDLLNSFLLPPISESNSNGPGKGINNIIKDIQFSAFRWSFFNPITQGGGVSLGNLMKP